MVQVTSSDQGLFKGKAENLLKTLASNITLVSWNLLDGIQHIPPLATETTSRTDYYAPAGPGRISKYSWTFGSFRSHSVGIGCGSLRPLLVPPLTSEMGFQAPTLSARISLNCNFSALGTSGPDHFPALKKAAEGALIFHLLGPMVTWIILCSLKPWECPWVCLVILVGVSLRK